MPVIVRVEVPIQAADLTEEEMKVRVYNETRSILVAIDLTEEIEEKLEGNLSGYFELEGYSRNEGLVHLGKKVPKQDWY